MGALRRVFSQADKNCASLGADFEFLGRSRARASPRNRPRNSKSAAQSKRTLLDHPLLEAHNKELRKRVVDLLKQAFTVSRDSNLVFVCGGNDPSHMRQRFATYFPDNLADFEFFEPEFAMENYFLSGDPEPFNIGDFEELVGRLSHSIVLFPEGPGSFAELGYFSMQPELASKTVLVIDTDRQLNDSFISLGPAAKISSTSVFQPTIYTNYAAPNFDLIRERLKSRKPLSRNRKTVKYDKFSTVSDYDLFALVFEIIQLLRFSTSEDLFYMLNAIFKGNINKSKVRKLISILVGSKRLHEYGDLGHLLINEKARTFFKPRDGYREQLFEVNVSIAQIINAASNDFAGLREQLDHAG